MTTTNQNPPMFCLLMTEEEKDSLIRGLYDTIDAADDNDEDREVRRLIDRLEKLPPADKAQLHA